MVRVVLTNEDLRGQLLDAAKQPDGHARESLVLDCKLDVTTWFVGDWRGTDFWSSGPADWSKAQTRGCNWQRASGLVGSRWPSDISYHNHDVIGAIIATALGTETDALLKQAMTQDVETIDEYKDNKVYLIDTFDRLLTIPGVTPAFIIDQARKLFAPYPDILKGLEWLLQRAQSTEPRPAEDFKRAHTVDWGDGAAVTIDTINPPRLPDPGRYSWRKWVEAQADAQVASPWVTAEGLQSHHVFIYSLSPIVAIIQATADSWFEGEPDVLGF